MPLNLDRVAAFAESYTMVDTCRIERKASGEEDIEVNWDETTGTYVPERVETRMVYRGRCMVYTRQPTARATMEGSAPTAAEQFYLSIPRQLDVHDRILPEDIVTVLESQDARLVGSMFSVDAVDEGTHLATRELRMTRFTGLVP